MKQYILAMDAGTTSERAILFDRAGQLCAMAQEALHLDYPHDGWVEQDAAEIWDVQLRVCRRVLAEHGIRPEQIAAIGITNQRETTVVWDKATGEPVAPAIVWQCRRTAAQADELRRRGLTETLRDKTGLVIDAYFSATKLRWILDTVPGARRRAENGELLFGTVDCWLIWKLTGGRRHVTDASNAARTMLYNIRTLDWDADILRELDIPACMLPEVVPSSGIVGETEAALFGCALPIGGIAGDQQAALFGQACWQPGEAKNTYGTGCFLLMNTGTAPVRSGNGLLTTIAWNIGGTVEYALEGSVFVAGAAIQWLRDDVGLLEHAADSEALARAVPDAGGVYLVPAFTGLGAPYWDAYARGVLVGLTRATGRAHIVRAALESMAHQTADVLDAMQRDAGLALQSLKADGGASANDLLMELQADLIGVPVERPACVETTALGAACLAGLASGFWESRADIRRTREAGRVFHPQLDAARREAQRAGWRRAVSRALGWAKPE
ncbi:MAG TPA: glycerol kinase GlpK [Candidatus Butyricicoccus stercorigallinarum]|nr:glycerol kinase GlpK [Candidatus Butyricicoccus stercorigallinarum]